MAKVRHFINFVRLNKLNLGPQRTNIYSAQRNSPDFNRLRDLFAEIELNGAERYVVATTTTTSTGTTTSTTVTTNTFTGTIVAGEYNSCRVCNRMNATECARQEKAGYHLLNNFMFVFAKLVTQKNRCHAQSAV